MLIKLPLPAEDQEGNQLGEEGSVHFFNAGAVTANLKLEVLLSLMLENAGKALVWGSQCSIEEV